MRRAQGLLPVQVPGLWLLACAVRWIPPAFAVQHGMPLPTDDPSASAVVAVWGKPGTTAEHVRCSGVFIAPEVVLTAAACVLAERPATPLVHMACAHGDKAGCRTLPPSLLEVVAASDLPDEREATAEVLALEFRYSVPSEMPQVCSGGAVCGEGWDIAALRVRQLCPRQRCVPPLPLSLGSLEGGEMLRLVGTGVDPGAPSSELAGHALRYQDGALAAIRANQSLVLANAAGDGVPALGAADGSSGDSASARVGSGASVSWACHGDDGAPLLRYEATLEPTTGDGVPKAMYALDDADDALLDGRAHIVAFDGRSPASASEETSEALGHLDSGRASGVGVADGAAGATPLGIGSEGRGYAGRRLGASAARGGWAVVGIHSRVRADACAAAPRSARGTAAADAAADAAATRDARGGVIDAGGRAWSVRVSRCWLWRTLALWRTLPEASLPAERGSSPPSPPLPPISPDARQWTERVGVRRLTRRVQSECAGTDHWPPELLSPSAALPPEFALRLAQPTDPLLPALRPLQQPARSSVCYASKHHFCVHLLSERGRLRYSIDGGAGSAVGRTLSLTRLVTYTFQMVGVHAAHPYARHGSNLVSLPPPPLMRADQRSRPTRGRFVISESETGPDRRRTVADEIHGAHPAIAYETFRFTASLATPPHLWYQSATRSGVGGPIRIVNTAHEEPRSLPGGTAAPSPTASALLLWDAHGATLHRWRRDEPAADGVVEGGESSGSSRGLEVVDHLPLASIARAALYNRTYARWRTAYDARMAHAPVAPNVTHVNVTNSTNTTLVYIRDGVEVKATNMTAEWLAFEATLPQLEPTPIQRIASALLRPATSELFWSTVDGHLLSATLGVQRLPDGTPHGVELVEPRLLTVGNESGVDVSTVKAGLESSRDAHTLLYHDAHRVPRHLDLDTLVEDDSIHFYNQSLERGQQRLELPDGGIGGTPAEWFDTDSPLVADWRRGLMLWCQRSQRRILMAPIRRDLPVIILVNHTLCTGLALDVVSGDVYWTSASGHLVYRASYVAHDDSLAREAPERPLYVLANDDHSLRVFNASVQTVVSAEVGADLIEPPDRLDRAPGRPDDPYLPAG